MGFYDDFIAGLRGSLRENFEDKPSRMARSAGTHPSTLSRILDGERQTWLQVVSRLADSAGLKVSRSDEPISTPGRDICFVNAKVVPIGEGQGKPEAEDYLAVPLVDEVGAGPGLLPQGELLSWFLVYRHQDAVRFRRNLIAVQIGKYSKSMQPILHPKDIVLVDLDDRDTSTPGRIMLVADPEGAGMIKRVAVEQKRSDYRIIFYSDNAAENPPMVFSWREDYLKNWERAIIGRVVWAWSDISNK